MTLFRLKRGCGKHYFRGTNGRRVMSPGETIECDRSDLGGAVDKFEQIGPEPPEPQPTIGLRLEKVAVDGKNRYNIVNETTGKPINDVPLKKREAERMISEATTEERTEQEPDRMAEDVAVPDRADGEAGDGEV